MRITPLLFLPFLLPYTYGTGLDFIADWLKGIGISYVAPMPRQGTCRDCSRSSLARFGFDITPTQPTGPCCPDETTTTTTTTTTITTTTTTTASTCTCGLEGTTRIVGGAESTAGKYPWIISVNFGSTDGSNPGGCAATLVAANWAITATHCITESGSTTLSDTKESLSLVLGEFDLSSSTDSDDGKRKNVMLALDPIVHESFRSPKPDSNDIALLKLAEDVDLTTYTPACLPASGSDYTGQNGRVYGWGSTASCPAVSSSVLLEVEVPIVSDTVCEAASSDAVTSSVNGQCVTEARSYSGVISSDMVCAGSSGKDACQGDSGGPFTVKSSSTSQHDLVGVVSWGYGCAADGLYGVYAEVAQLRTWIDEKIAANGGATFCS